MSVNALPSFTSYPLYEYRLIIRPPQALRQKLDHLRQEARKHFGWQLWNSAYNHMSVAHFFQYGYQEQKLTDRLREALMAEAPYRLQWQRYAMASAQNLVLEAEQPLAHARMVASVQAQKAWLRAGSSPLHIDNKPQLIIGQRLNAEQATRAMHLLGPRQPQGGLLVDGLLLIRRQHSVASWQIAERFELLNMPVAVQQGRLFA